jgi:hypothetical protein
VGCGFRLCSSASARAAASALASQEDYKEASVRNSSALKRIDADARFSSRCAIEEVPGIGSMAGDRCSSQASAIWLGVAPWLWTIRASGELGLASLPAASGYQGIKAMPAAAQISISPSDVGSSAEFLAPRAREEQIPDPSRAKDVYGRLRLGGRTPCAGPETACQLPEAAGFNSLYLAMLRLSCPSFLGLV